MIMAPRPGDRNDAEGALNPAVARTPDRRLHLCPRWSGTAISPESASPESFSTTREIRSASSASASPSKDHPNRIIYRSPEPVLEPEGPLECRGAVDNVVFPTGIDRRMDLGSPDRFDIYYGMADDRIGVARLDLPETLPGRVKESNQAEV